VIFGNVSLTSANEHVTAKALEAEKISILTANAPIFGDFKANESISLATANAPVRASVELVNDNSSQATLALVSTSNSNIDISSKLTSGADNAGSFGVAASTVRGKVDMKFTDAPVDSILTVNAETALADVEVYLHPTYQGSFELSTELAAVRLHNPKNVDDPAGRGRKRVVHLDRDSKTRIEGETWWGKKGEPLGAVKLKTSLAAATLHLDES